MEQQISANNLKTSLLVFVLLILFFAVGSLVVYFSGDYLWGGIIFVVGIMAVFMSYRGALKSIVSVTHAVPATRKSHRLLYLTVENLSITLGIRTPKIYVINDPALNAFAAGHKIENSIIGVTSGLLEKLDRQELEGVIAHELSHIVNRDVRLATLVYALVIGLGLMTEMNIRGGSRSLSSKRSGGGMGFLLIVALSILLWVLAFLAKMALSRQREYLADVTGAQITRYPDGLASALEKIKLNGHQLRRQKNSALAHLFLANPVKKGFLANLIGTHPPLEERIERLRQLNLSGF